MRFMLWFEDSPTWRAWEDHFGLLYGLLTLGVSVLALAIGVQGVENAPFPYSWLLGVAGWLAFLVAPFLMMLALVPLRILAGAIDKLLRRRGQRAV